MKRNRTPITGPSRVASALVGAALLVLTSCGGDDGGSGGGLVPSESLAADMGSSDTISEDDMAIAGAMLGLSEKCTAIYTSMMDAFATLGSADVSAKDTFDALVSEFNDIRDMVPGDLKGDIDVLAEAYGRYGELLAQAEDDPNIFADPDFMAEFDSIMMTDEFNAANERFTNWINTECAVGS